MNSSPSHSAPVPARRVLLVDSAECDLRVVSSLLVEAGFAVTVTNGQSAPSSAFEAAVIETRIDGRDGVSFAGELLSSGDVQRVVFYTEQQETSTLRDAQRVGPVVDKEDGPFRLLAVLQTAGNPVSRYPDADSIAPAAAEGAPLTRKQS